MIPSVREHLPSVVWGAALPLGIYFLVRSHVQTDTQALIIAGAFSAAWVVFQFVRQRRIDLVGVIVLSGFAVGVASAELLGGNSYMLKVRDAFFTAIFGVVCIITIFTHRRPALFYVGRYLSAGQDPAKLAAYNELHEAPIGRRTFRVLSVVWGIGLIVEAGFAHDAGRSVAHRDVPGRVALHHRLGPRQPLCLHRRVRAAFRARDAAPRREARSGRATGPDARRRRGVRSPASSVLRPGISLGHAPMPAESPASTKGAGHHG